MSKINFFAVAKNLTRTENEECLHVSDQYVPCVRNEGAVSDSQCINQLPHGSKNAQHFFPNKSLHNDSMSAKVEVASVIERRCLEPFTIRGLLESQTVDNPLDVKKNCMTFCNRTQDFLSSHAETDVTNGPGLDGYKNTANDLGDVPQFTEQQGRYAGLVVHSGSIRQTPVDGNRENTISDVADFTDSIVEVKVKEETGVVGEHQLTGSDPPLTNGPSVKVAFDSVQGKSDVVMDSDTQIEFANGSGFAPHFSEQQKCSVSVRPYQCKICGFKFKDKRWLKNHLNIHSRPYKCTFCDRKFPREHLRKMHEQIHKGTLPQCPVCGGRYVCLQKHMEIHNVDNVDTFKHVCSVCKKVFRAARYLKKHALVHTDERRYSCQDCGKRFRTSTHLKTHCIGVHTKEGNHVCSVCGKRFPQGVNLRIHMTAHFEDRPHRCETCDKAFKTKMTLTTHQKTHSSEKSFTCNTCGKQFRRSGSLQRHELIHSGVQPYECSVCGMKFNQSCSLTRHMLTHTGEKPYSCSDCGERFTQSGALASHRRRHCVHNKSTMPRLTI